MHFAIRAGYRAVMENAADGYWVQETYRTMIAQISILDERPERTALLERIERRYEFFQPQLSALSRDIQAYADQLAAQEAARQQAAAAEAARLQQEAAAAEAARLAAEAQAAAQAQAEAQQEQQTVPETQPETQPDYSAGPGAFPNSGNGPSSSRVTIIPQGPGGENE